MVCIKAKPVNLEAQCGIQISTCEGSSFSGDNTALSVIVKGFGFRKKNGYIPVMNL